MHLSTSAISWPGLRGPRLHVIHHRTHLSPDSGSLDALMDNRKGTPLGAKRWGELSTPNTRRNLSSEPNVRNAGVVKRHIPRFRTSCSKKKKKENRKEQHCGPAATFAVSVPTICVITLLFAVSPFAPLATHPLWRAGAPAEKTSFTYLPFR